MDQQLLMRRKPWSAAAKRLQCSLDHAVDSYGSFAAVMGVRLPGGETALFASGHADLDRTRPARADDIFLIASQSKTLTAIATLLLIKDGQLDLQTPLSRWFGRALADTITVERALMHQTGLGEYSFCMGPMYRWDVAYTPAELLALSNARGSSFAPGDRFDYANINYVLLGSIVQEITGLTLGEFLRRRLFEPLGLAFWFAHEGDVPRDRLLHSGLRRHGEAALTPAIDTDLSWSFGTGDAATNIEGLLDLWTALANSDRRIGISLNDLIVKAGVANKAPAFALSVGKSYAYGVERAAWAGPLVWGHPGKTLGSSSGTWCDPARGVSISLCVTSYYDPSEDLLPYVLRYPGPQLYAAALAAAYAAVEAH